jgi:hypothetical protein
MFERIGQSAEQCATKLARRAFFIKLGQAALPLAAAVGGLSVLSRGAHAYPSNSRKCCTLPDGSTCYVAGFFKGNCPGDPHEVKPFPCPTGSIPKCPF